MVSGAAPWWQKAVVYQVYPRAFADGSLDDGIGDLAGIHARLDYIRDLGVDAVWLSPIFPSPMCDNGYDVSDYCNIDPLFGDLATFDRLLTAAHERGLRVLLDWVPNHTSSLHPWFLESRSSRTSAKRDWYYWRDGSPDTPPNNWLAAFGGRAWTWDDTTEQWYLHLFLPEQPDLNWGNPEVQAAMHNTLRFWLDRGVDGFRMDVIHLIGKDPALPDAPPEEAHTNRVPYNDYPGTHPLLRGIRAVLDSYPGEPMMVGEVNLRETARISTYYGDCASGVGDELHLAFNFLSLAAGWDADAWHSLIDTVDRDLQPGAWPTWVLSNHDVRRLRTRLGGSERRARAMAVLLLTLRGTPFLYAGEELGLEDAVVPKEQALDPGRRDGCRAPIPWTAAPPHGWTGMLPPLPFPPDADTRSVERQETDANSMLVLYRRLLDLRRASPALHSGSLQLLDSPSGVLGYARRDEGGADEWVVLLNFNAGEAAVPLGTAYEVVVASNDVRVAGPYAGVVPSETALLLRRLS